MDAKMNTNITNCTDNEIQPKLLIIPKIPL